MEQILKKLSLITLTATVLLAHTTQKQNIDDAFYEQFVKSALNATPVLVRDTDSPLGRYNLYPKELYLKTLARAHGHLCDGLILAYVELSHALPKLFNDGVIDRTDIRVVAKNSPCLVDTSALMSGARINHKTLSLDNSLGGSFIVQRISTGKTYKVSLRDTSFLKALKNKEEFIKAKQKKHQQVTPQDIDEAEALELNAIRYMINTNPKQLLTITELKNYTYHFNISDISSRSDVINKNVARKK